MRLRRFVRLGHLARLAAVLLAGLGAPGCYNPKIEEGAFFCGDGGNCPEGFGCDHGRCYKMATAECALCTPPAAAVAGGMCDPICQSGCKCNQQCVPNAPKPTCVDVKTTPKAVYESCSESADLCTAGSLCIPDRDDNAACGAHCFRMCRTHADCGAASRCLDGVGIAGSNMSYGLCSSEIEACSPLGPNPRCMRGDRRPSPPFACYILSLEEPELTVCECAGTANEGDTCINMHDCKPGLECIKRGAESVCRQLCRPEGSILPGAVDCKNPLLHCNPFGEKGRSRFGYCI